MRKVSVFLGRPFSHFTERAECEGGPIPTHLASQCPKQGGEAAQAADGFVHMELQGLRCLGGVGQQGLATQDGF